MNKIITHTVFISINAKSSFGRFLSSIGSQLIEEMDNPQNNYICLWCSEVNTNHPVYLEVVVQDPNTVQQSSDTDIGLRLRIPHHFVSLIADPPLNRKKLGF